MWQKDDRHSHGGLAPPPRERGSERASKQACMHEFVLRSNYRGGRTRVGTGRSHKWKTPKDKVQEHERQGLPIPCAQHAFSDDATAIRRGLIMCATMGVRGVVCGGSACQSISQDLAHARPRWSKRSLDLERSASICKRGVHEGVPRGVSWWKLLNQAACHALLLLSSPN